MVLLHHTWKRMLDGKLCIAPIDDPRCVLDVGTGTGTWAIEFVDEHQPRLKRHARAQASVQKLSPSSIANINDIPQHVEVEQQPVLKTDQSGRKASSLKCINSICFSKV